jgi:hypothetical protein
MLAYHAGVPQNKESNNKPRSDVARCGGRDDFYPGHGAEA